MRASRFRVLALLSIMAVTPASRVHADAFTDSQESSLFDLGNGHRGTEHGVPPLQLHDGLRTVARRQAQRIAAAGYLYHNPKLAEEVEEVLPGWRHVGENVGFDQDSTSMFEGFLGSAQHHANIDRPGYDQSGIGVVRESDERLYFAQVFAEAPSADRVRRAIPLQTPRPIAPKTAAPETSPLLASAVPTTPEVATPTPEPATIVHEPSTATPSRRSRPRSTLVGSLLASFREAFGRLIPG